MASDDAAWLDSMYDNRARVPEYPVHFRRWAEASARARAELPCELDLLYGRGPNETLDVFPPHDGGAAAPVLFFIHGGWWRSMDKREHAFIAPAFTSRACVVLPNYALCPDATIPQIVMQMVRALAWTWRNVSQLGGDPSRITVAGHSAGGHLAAMMLACLWQRHDPDLPAELVRNALSISGLHELDSMMRTPSLQRDLRLTPAQARQASPAWFEPPPRGELYAVVGAQESNEFLRHSALIRQAWGAARVPVCEVLPQLNHFSVLEALAAPGQRLHALATELLAR